MAGSEGAAAQQCAAATRLADLVLPATLFGGTVAAATASGGSTNAVLHLLAMAGEIDVELSLTDIDAVSRRTPLLGDLKPGDQFTAAELHQAGGAPALLRELLGAGAGPSSLLWVVMTLQLENSLQPLRLPARRQVVIRFRRGRPKEQRRGLRSAARSGCCPSR